MSGAVDSSCSCFVLVVVVSVVVDSVVHVSVVVEFVVVVSG